MKNFVAPSVLAADKSKLVKEVKKVESCGAEYLHFDVMDGKFVPNVSYSSEDLKSIVGHHKMVNDVHIMVSDPLAYAKEFIPAGADILTFHVEAVECPKCTQKIINYIKENKCKVGMSIKPKTSWKALLPYIDQLDLVLVMSVEPGFGGQKFMPVALKKIKKLRKYIDKHQLNTLIEVDGGINGETGKLCREVGADILVAGTYVFKGEDYKQRIDSLR